MPGFDRTGPLGKGAFSGRGMGPCNTQAGFGRGQGFFFGMCRGRARGAEMAFPTLSKEERVKFLREQKELIEQEINEME